MTHKIVGKRDILGKVSNFFLINCLQRKCVKKANQLVKLLRKCNDKYNLGQLHFGTSVLVVFLW